MFYKEEDISNELICPKCTNRFDDPRILPCGNSLCQSCIIDEIDNENKAMNKCYCCQEKHSLPKEGEFIQNRFILKQLEKKPIKIERGALGEQLKQSMIEITEKKQELETVIKGSNQIVSDYLSEIISQIDLITETQIERLNKDRENLLDKIKQYQIECIYSKRTNQTDFLTKLDEFNEKMREYLNGTQWKEIYVNEKIKEAKYLVGLCSKAKEDFENEIFLNKKPTFIPFDMALNEIQTIGKLNFNNLDVIENQKENVDINQNINELQNSSIIDKRLSWMSNISMNQTKLIKNVDCVYNLKDSFFWINYNVRLSDSILTFYKDGTPLRNYFDNYDKQVVIGTEFYNNFLFLKCRDWKNNMHIFMTHFENDQWLPILEGGGSSSIVNQFHTMAANDAYLYCFYNTQIFPYDYKRFKINRKEKLPFTVLSAKDGCKVKVDRKFFYVLSDINDEKSIYIHNLYNGIISKIIPQFNIIDICLVKKGLLAGLYFENSSLMINVFEGGDGKLLINKQLIPFLVNDKNVLKKLKLVNFSEESLLILDQCNSIVYWNELEFRKVSLLGENQVI